MKKISLTIAIIAGLMSLDAHAQARKLPELVVLEAPQTTRNAAVRSLLSLKPALPTRVPGGPNQPPYSGHWLLIVVDADAASSYTFLRLVKQEKFSAARSVLLVTGARQSAERAALRGDFFTEAPWASSDLAPAITAFKLNGTPMVYALNRENKIVWQQAGTPEKPGNLVLRMVDWVASHGE